MPSTTFSLMDYLLFVDLSLWIFVVVQNFFQILSLYLVCETDSCSVYTSLFLQLCTVIVLRHFCIWLNLAKHLRMLKWRSIWNQSGKRYASRKCVNFLLSDHSFAAYKNNTIARVGLFQEGMHTRGYGTLRWCMYKCFLLCIGELSHVLVLIFVILM